MKINYVGIFYNEEWQSYTMSFKIELNGHTFDYSQGLGHLKIFSSLKLTKLKSKGVKRLGTISASDDHKLNAAICNALIRSNYTSIDRTAFWNIVDLKYGSAILVIEPDHDSILECLYYDTLAGQDSFDEFCDNHGYSNDSLKALDVYRACMDNARKLKGFKFPQHIIDGESA